MIPGIINLIIRKGTAGSFGAVASPASVSGADTPGTITTNTTTVTPSGGVAPYTYLWSISSGGSNISATATTSATTAFQSDLNSPNETTTGSWVCKVTDATAAFVYSNIVYVNLRSTRS